MVAGSISKTSAVTFAVVLGVAGVAVLFFYTSILALGVALLGVFFYLVLYTPLKRKAVHATLVGAVAGATPPVVGYVAVAGKFDVAAALLLLILVFWQMPHFYAIAVRRIEEYRAAAVPVMPIEHGLVATKVAMLWYIAAYTVVAAALTYFGYTGYVYLALVALSGVYWFLVAAKDFHADTSKDWAKKVFFSSLLVLAVFCVSVSFGLKVW
jgi:protoheme IX farnesyltransferase